MKKVIFLLTLMLTSAFALNALAQVPLVSIDTVLKAVDEMGRPTFGSATVAIVGVCISPYNQDPNRFQRYIMDTGTWWGILVDKSAAAAQNPDYALGDLMYVEGTVSFFMGLIEFTPINTTEKIGSGYGYPTTIVPSISAMTGFDQTLATGGEYYEGRLIRLNNIQIVGGDPWPSSGSNANIQISDYSGATILMRIDKDYDLDENPQPLGVFDVVGIASQYDTSSPYTEVYQILPRLVSDIIIKISVTPAGPLDVELKKSVQLTASAILDGAVTWTSSDTTIAKVESTGDMTAKVTGVGLGTCTITATGIQGVYEAISDPVTINVIPSTTQAPIIEEPKKSIIHKIEPVTPTFWELYN